MTNRALTAPVTLAVAAVLVVIMAVWGVSASTAPFDDDPSSEPTCAPEDRNPQTVIRRGDVTVSVYNAGKRRGLAGDTVELLEAAGFRPGEIGNAPKGTKVGYAQVRTSSKGSPQARLVAASLGKSAKVVVVDDDLGPGVVVFIGDDFTKLNPNAPRQIKVPSGGGCG